MNFSVVIPLYNKALHIERAINSVLNQTVQDFEIIVVNDGSTDHGEEIVKRITDPRIRLINQENRGVSAARNRGAEEAKYDLIAYLDADDEWLPEYLRNIQMLINNFPDCGAYATAVKAIRPNRSVFYPNISSLPTEPWIGIVPNIFQLISDAPSAIHSSAVVIPRKILSSVGGFPLDVTLMEDITCWIKIAVRYPIAYNTKRLAIYHQESENRSSNQILLNDAPFSNEIFQAIDSGQLTQYLAIEAKEFANKYRLIAAINNILKGNSNQAHILLTSCKSTKKYRKRWTVWNFMSFLPSRWIITFLKMKTSLFAGK